MRRESLPATLDTGRRRYDGKRSGVVGVVVFVLVSGMLGGVGCDSDAVFEHEVGELVAVDEADMLGSDGDGLGGLSGCVGEVGCCDEDAPGGSVGVEAAGEVPDLGFSDRVCPAFGLDVEPVEAEGVLIDDAVDVSVSGASDLAGVSVAHVFEEVDDCVLELLGWEVVEGVDGEAVGLSRSEWRGVRSEWVSGPWMAER